MASSTASAKDELGKPTTRLIVEESVEAEAGDAVLGEMQEPQPLGDQPTAAACERLADPLAGCHPKRNTLTERSGSISLRCSSGVRRGSFPCRRPSSCSRHRACP